MVQNGTEFCPDWFRMVHQLVQGGGAVHGYSAEITGDGNCQGIGGNGHTSRNVPAGTLREDSSSRNVPAGTLREG